MKTNLNNFRIYFKETLNTCSLHHLIFDLNTRKTWRKITLHITQQTSKKERKIDKKNIQNTYNGGEKEKTYGIRKNAFISFPLFSFFLFFSLLPYFSLSSSSSLIISRFILFLYCVVYGVHPKSSGFMFKSVKDQFCYKYT